MKFGKGFGFSAGPFDGSGGDVAVEFSIFRTIPGFRNRGSCALYRPANRRPCGVTPRSDRAGRSRPASWGHKTTTACWRTRWSRTRNQAARRRWSRRPPRRCSACRVRLQPDRRRFTTAPGSGSCIPGAAHRRRALDGYGGVCSEGSGPSPAPDAGCGAERPSRPWRLGGRGSPREGARDGVRRQRTYPRRRWCARRRREGG